MAKPKHPGSPHKYQRKKWGKNKTVIWRCMLPDCGHYVHDEFVVGKKSVCHKCHGIFVMTSEKTRRVKPKCDSCTLGKDPILVDIDKLLEGML